MSAVANQTHRVVFTHSVQFLEQSPVFSALSGQIEVTIKPGRFALDIHPKR
ncbi:hypothetical protein CLOSTMETH_00216 [[Clostridium] methylpentosum DSM 5476]|uniref:Uncharacterized protein n=1 Tax=[Clostridium] methylpentosum DSM 5476 TaxID=537013 RepID=C0E8S1_9FIRM|nr:hypothetical protein CLOSTMETH_00216 [[Clostridium] methylpentosum DSM 5476]